MEFVEAKNSSDFCEAKELFREYIESLKEFLGSQDFEGELSNIEERYLPPKGLLILVKENGAAFGCIGLKKLSSTDCEMKRLYVKPEYRAKGAGKKLVELIIEKAKDSGYKAMFLDTLPQLKSAVRLYESLGFIERNPYYKSPIANPVFMELKL